MYKSPMGNIFPIINHEKCINCGFCYNICPCTDETGLTTLNEQDTFAGHYISTYTGRTLDNTIYHNSQSGGLVTQTLSYLFDANKIDAAIVCKQDYGNVRPVVKPFIVTCKDELLATQGSSYTPVDIVSAINSVSGYNSVAIVGLPCHLQGIDSLIVKTNKYGNIRYKLGLICDRVLSEAVDDILINLVKTKGNIKIPRKIKWRDKRNASYKNAPVVIEYENNYSEVIPAAKRHMLKNDFTSPRCRICFDKLNIHADIVFGDPWGMNNIDWENGESLE
ncbi:hypothetical protein FACS1894163_11820 [Spirochaetia bacterium]|nr:hypothetical protein FACS1894163_11820 [Spirochaetia bacterium]